MAKFFVNTGHTLYHLGRVVIHAGEEIADEIITAIRKDAAHFKAMIDAGIIVGEKPQINTATDQGAPSHGTAQIRPVGTAQGEAGPTAPPVVDAPAPELAAGAKSQTDNTGKPVSEGLSEGLSE
jgi:hypothetical protein